MRSAKSVSSTGINSGTSGLCVAGRTRASGWCSHASLEHIWSQRSHSRQNCLKGLPGCQPARSIRSKRTGITRWLAQYRHSTVGSGRVVVCMGLGDGPAGRLEPAWRAEAGTPIHCHIRNTISIISNIRPFQLAIRLPLSPEYFDFVNEYISLRICV